MGNIDDREPLEKLQRSLYKRGGKAMRVKRSELPDRDDDTSESWGDEVIKKVRRTNNTPLFNKLLLIGIVFFVGSLLFASIVLLRGGNVISGGNIELNVTGPTIIKAGDESSFVVSIGNKNNIELETVELLVEYPEGTRNFDNLSDELNRERERLGSIAQGEVVNKTFRAALFGEADTKKEVLISIEYRVAGSNAIFDKKIVHEVIIGSAPLGLKIEVPSEVNSGQEITIDVDVTADSETTLLGLAVRGIYPSGFEFIRAIPGPTNNDDFWSIGDMAPGDSKSIRIIGKINGQDNDSKNIRFEVGQKSPGEDQIAVVYNSNLRGVEIKRPFVSLDIILPGGGDDIVVSGGQSLRADVSWINNTSNRIADGVLEVEILGDALDKTSVSAGSGFYRSSDSTIIWDFKNTSILEEISAGGSGIVGFSFKVFSSDSSGKTISNPNVLLRAKFVGKSDGQSDIALISREEKIVRVTSSLQLAVQAVYSIGPFANSGPLPPVVDQKTSYTVTWSVVNPSNELRSTVAKTILPSYVQWLGATSPFSEDITYNSNTGEVTWNVGDVSAGVGSDSPAREASFQINFAPSVSQQGEKVPLTGDTSVTAYDSFTKTNINLSKDGVTTRISSDPIYTEGMEKVI